MITSMQREAIELGGGDEPGLSYESLKNRVDSGSKFVLITAEEKLDDQARKRVMQDLRKKYVRRISKRSINDLDQLSH